MTLCAVCRQPACAHTDLVFAGFSPSRAVASHGDRLLAPVSVLHTPRRSEMGALSDHRPFHAHEVARP